MIDSARGPAGSSPGAIAAVLAYSGLAILMTWPLALGLGRDIPGDLGDSLLNMWILGWGADHVPRLLTGGLSWQGFWNANIFFPEPLALALSEHLFGQTLTILPVYALTGNLILCYNLIFLSTFVVSAWGTYLLVRDLTADSRAAFVAGLVFGFLPYRVASIPHVQVMSAQWMPLALFGLNRFATARSTRGLVGGTAALVMQNWSCGYYLLYFAPFVPLFVLQRLWVAGRLRDLRAWLSLALAAAATLALTLPFLLPYLDARRRFGLERPFGEVVGYSANVWSYVTAPEALRLWGRALRFYPHGEGETFLGFAAWALAALGVAQVAWRAAADEHRPAPAGWRRVLTWVLVAAVVTQGIGVLSAVTFGGFDLRLFGLPLRARTPVRLITQFVVATALLLAVSPRIRGMAARMSRSPVASCCAATVLAVWLSLGPVPAAGDQGVSGISLYAVLYDHVPGFDLVRVPARYAMIAGLFLSVLAGYGAAVITPWKRGTALAILAGVLVLADSAAFPLEVNRSWAQNEATPPAQVFPPAQAPPVYRAIAALPAGSAITEFPFGDFAWEIRYVYYSTAHWKPITNGYSGAFPPSYRARVARLQDVTTSPDASWRSLVDSGTTHVVVHTRAFADATHARAVQSWLDAHAATVVDAFPDGDVLYRLHSP